MQLLSPEDRAQVKAILMTHAEMQDHRTVESEVVLGRLKADEEPDDEVREMIDDLEESIKDCTEDSENLKRLASKF